MRLLLLLPIYLYWHLLPASWKQRQCLFSESCSHYVWRITREQGLVAGCRALRHRHKNCRPGYKIEPISPGRFRVQLLNGDVIPDSEVADAVLSPYLKACSPYPLLTR